MNTLAMSGNVGDHARLKPIRDNFFGTSVAHERPVQPSYPFADSFSAARHKVENAVGKGSLRFNFNALALAVFSTVSDGARLLFYWLALAVNSVSQQQIFRVEDSSPNAPNAFVDTTVVALPFDSSNSVTRDHDGEQLDALPCARECTVWAGDSVLHADGSVYKVKQPVINIWNSEAGVIAAKVGAWCATCCLLQ